MSQQTIQNVSSSLTLTFFFFFLQSDLQLHQVSQLFAITFSLLSKKTTTKNNSVCQHVGAAVSERKKKTLVMIEKSEYDFYCSALIAHSLSHFYIPGSSL